MADVIEYLLSELNTMNWVNARRNRHSVSVDLTLDDNPKTALQQLGLVQGKLRIINGNDKHSPTAPAAHLRCYVHSWDWRGIAGCQVSRCGEKGSCC